MSTESKAVPTVEVVGPGGTIKINDTPEEIAKYKRDGYLPKSEHVAREKAKEEAAKGKGDESTADADGDAKADEKPADKPKGGKKGKGD